jgi:hypothetical protein
MIDQIIALKQETGIVEENATLKKQLEWYKWAIQNGFVEAIIDNGRLLGFAEWIRLNDIPKDEYSWTELVDWKTVKTAPIGFVMNLCAKNKGVLKKLKDMMLSKNRDCKVLVWHNKKRNLMYVVRTEN